MKKILWFVFALFFNICRALPVNPKRVTFLAPHRGGAHDSLSELARRLESRGGYEIVRVNSSPSGIAEALRFFFVSPAKLATSKYIFLNDNFMPMASLRFSPQTVITQLWHGEGAFKKFGLLINLPGDIRQRAVKAGKKLSFVICTSENVKEIYAKAFGTDRDRVIPLGSPRLDYLLAGADREKLLEDFYSEFPSCRGKKLVLYAPTFRDNTEDDSAILSHIDADAFSEAAGDEYALLVKLHPQVHSSTPGSGVIDVTDLDTGNLAVISDILITDYSSVCMDFAVLDKPCIFYAYDLEKYEHDRSFCFGYRDYVPGEVFADFGSVIQAVKNPRNAEKLRRFRDFNFDYIDSRNSDRIIDYVMNSENRK